MNRFQLLWGVLQRGANFVRELRERNSQIEKYYDEVAMAIATKLKEEIEKPSGSTERAEKLARIFESFQGGRLNDGDSSRVYLSDGD